jgi:hypothetical protein
MNSNQRPTLNLGLRKKSIIQEKFRVVRDYNLGQNGGFYRELISRSRTIQTAPFDLPASNREFS